MSKNQVNKSLSESVTVAGYVSPVVANAPMKVSFVKPDNTTVDVPATANETGDFEVSYTPDVVGDWNVTAWWDGDQYHTYAFSEIMPLQVVGEEQPPPPPPPEEEGIPMEYIYVAVAVIAIVVIAVAAYAYMKRGKK